MARGRVGESYILAGPPLTYREAMEQWESIVRIPAPRVWAPGWIAAGLARLVSVLERAGLNLRLSSEALASLADYTYYGSAEKAKRELDWQPRPVEATFKEALDDWRGRIASRSTRSH